MLENRTVAELLAREADSAKFPAQRALRRASRRALLWEREAVEIMRAGTPLTELPGVGPYIEKLIARWIDNPPRDIDSPPLRSGFLTITEARHILAKKPTWLACVRGDLQLHTTWSDGEGTVEEMSAAARVRDYEYIAITDHSKGLKIAGGINEDKVEQQGRQIEALRKLDDQTERYIAALRNPDIQILGHPQGRIYNFRAGLCADWKRVFDVAAELDKAVEIDGYPDRQDLSIDLLKIAKRAGCRISFGTDSHGPSQLHFMEFSAAAALKAGISPELILNFMPKQKLLAWVDRVRTE
jgi:histidinol phosphatase-like PHP family hydrolase